MTAELINQLTTPLIFAVFSIGFAVIWLRYRHLKSAGFFALSYLAGTIAFIFDFVEGITNVHQFAHGIYISAFGDQFYLLLALTFTIGIAFRYRQPVPWRQLAPVYAAGTFGLLWFWFGDTNAVLRSYTVTTSCSVLMLLAVPMIWRGQKIGVDRALAWLLLFSCAQIVLNPIVTHTLANETLTMENMWGSTFLAVLNFSSAMIALAIAMTLFVSFGIAIISNYRDISNIDALTGLLNRRGLDDVLNAHTQNLAAARLPTSVVIADLDHFKSINDTLGHDFGDKVICSFSACMNSAVRNQDKVARLGGEEFLIFLPNCNVSMATLIAKSICRSFSEFDHHMGRGEPLYVTASLGVA